MKQLGDGPYGTTRASKWVVRDGGRRMEWSIEMGAQIPSRRLTLLVTNSVGWPGNAATGPNQSLRTIYDALGDEFDIRVLAGDRPRGEREPLALAGQQERIGKATVTYVSPDVRGLETIRRALMDGSIDILWLQSFFAPMFTIAPLMMQRLGIVPRTPTVLSPRGELSAQALAHSFMRKHAYLSVARTFDLFRNVTIHATSESELRAVEQRRLRAEKVEFAPDMATVSAVPERTRGDVNVLRLVFVGRISPFKGLDTALRALSQVRSRVDFDIFGPVQDHQFFHRCQSLGAALPGNVRMAYHGALTHSEVIGAMAKYDLLILPSKSENFGHSILEALSAGTPVLIGDKTPWRGLDEAGAGWERQTDAIADFADCIERAAALPPSERAAMSARARAFAEKSYSAEGAILHTRDMLMRAVKGA